MIGYFGTRQAGRNSALLPRVVSYTKPRKALRDRACFLEMRIKASKSGQREIAVTHKQGLPATITQNHQMQHSAANTQGQCLRNTCIGALAGRRQQLQPAFDTGLRKAVVVSGAFAQHQVHR